MREVHRNKPREFVRLTYADILLVQGADNPSRESGFSLMNIRVRIVKVAQDISATADEFNITLYHRKASLNRLTRSLIGPRPSAAS